MSLLPCQSSNTSLLDLFDSGTKMTFLKELHNSCLGIIYFLYNAGRYRINNLRIQGKSAYPLTSYSPQISFEEEDQVSSIVWASNLCFCMFRY